MLRSYFVLVGGVLSGAFLLAALLATGAAAGMSQDLARCTAAKDRGAVSACTRVMNSGRLPNAQMYIGYFNRGTAWRQVGEPEKAVADFSKAMQLKPSFVRSYEARGKAQADLGAFSKALADLDEAVRRGNDWRFLYSRAVVLRAEGDRAAALRDLDAAAAQKPDAAQIKLMRALIFSEQGKHAEARAQIDGAVVKDEEEAWAHYARAAISFRDGQAADAEIEVDRALGKRSDFSAANALKGQILDQRGEKDKARSSYEKALADTIDSFDGRAARRVVDAQLGVRKQNVAAKLGRDVAESRVEVRPVDCKVFLPATGSVVTSKCGE